MRARLSANTASQARSQCGFFRAITTRLQSLFRPTATHTNTSSSLFATKAFLSRDSTHQRILNALSYADLPGSDERQHITHRKD